MPEPKNKNRLDSLLMERGLFTSRTRCQEAIAAGNVKVNGEVCAKPGAKFAEDIAIELLEADHPYVSRGGLKLAGAVADFRITLQGKVALDVGASTGGFTDFMLQAGVERCFCIDVGRDQLHEKIRNDARVKFWEATDIRAFSPSILSANIDIITVDVSFISLEKVLPALAAFLSPGRELLALVKPQFEVGKGNLDKGGIVKDASLREQACAAAARFCSLSGFEVKGILPSRLSGADGNQEFFLYAKKILPDENPK